MKIKKKSLLNPKTFNILYSIGASVVILGALFKLLHVDHADAILVIGMGTEAVIFFLSAFDEPTKEPNWENVYPGIYDQKTLSAEEKAELAERRKNHVQSPTIVGGGTVGGGTIIIGGGSNVAPSGNVPAAAAVEGLGQVAQTSGCTEPVSADQADAVAAATAKYVEQLNGISQSLEKLQQAMQGMGDNGSYAQQMEALNRNITGLNTIYEIQLKSVSAQLSTIEEVNRGLNNIRSLYENGANDSFRIRQESDQLARNLQQLNEVYARMLQAMTVNAGFKA